MDGQMETMLWALKLESNGKRYSHTVELPYHISMAALDVQDGKPKDKFVSVYIEVKGQAQLLCNLNRSTHPQQPMDLIIGEDEEVTFFVKGEGTVYVSGYHLPPDEAFDEEGFSDEDGELDEEAEVSDSDEEAVPKATTSGTIVNGNASKRKQQEEPVGQSIASAKKSKVVVASPTKSAPKNGDKIVSQKSHSLALLTAGDLDEEDEDDSDVDSGDFDDLMGEDLDEEDDEDEEDEEGEDAGDEKEKSSSPTKPQKGKKVTIETSPSDAGSPKKPFNKQQHQNTPIPGKKGGNKFGSGGKGQGNDSFAKKNESFGKKNWQPKGNGTPSPRGGGGFGGRGGHRGRGGSGQKNFGGRGGGSGFKGNREFGNKPKAWNSAKK